MSGAEIPFIGLVIIAVIYIGPLFHILLSSRSHGGAKFGWFVAYVFFWWLSYIVFLIVTQKNIDKE